MGILSWFRCCCCCHVPISDRSYEELPDIEQIDLRKVAHAESVITINASVSSGASEVSIEKQRLEGPSGLLSASSAISSSSTFSSSSSIANEDKKAGKSNKLRIVCISDTHCQIDKIKHIPDGDILIHSGDATKWNNSHSTIREFNRFMGTLPHKYKFFVPGNHDLCLAELLLVNNAAQQRENLERIRTEILSNMIFLHDEEYVIETRSGKVKVYGTAWRPGRGCCYKAEAFGWPAATIDEKRQEIPSDTDILITHGPPWGVFDGERGHVGCDALFLHVTQRIQPKLHVFGHCHRFHGAAVLPVFSSLGAEAERNPQITSLESSSEHGKTEILFVNAASKIADARMRNPIVVEYLTV